MDRPGREPATDRPRTSQSLGLQCVASFGQDEQLLNRAQDIASVDTGRGRVDKRRSQWPQCR